jgi:ribosomal protein L16 Arg81 hydroxylase
MTLDNLITLISAGFTKEEILTMSGTATQRAPQPQPQPQFYPQNYQQALAQDAQGYTQQFPQMFPQPHAQAYHQTQAQQARQIGDQNDVLSALKSLTSAVQSNNVNLMQNTVPKQVSTEDAIASIINPPNYEGLTGGEK